MKPTTIPRPKPALPPSHEAPAQPRLATNHPINRAAFREAVCVLVVVGVLFAYFVVTRAKPERAWTAKPAPEVKAQTFATAASDGKKQAAR